MLVTSVSIKLNNQPLDPSYPNVLNCFIVEGDSLNIGCTKEG